MALIRSFLAVPLPAELQARLACLQQELKQSMPELRASAPENLHLSLQFLGNQSQEILDKVGRLMLSTGACSPSFSVFIRGLGGFPDGRRPRVVWLGVDPPAQLSALQAALAEGLAELGLPRETRSYRPHLTLGRLRRPPADSGIMERLKSSDCGQLGVTRLVLFSSQLTPQGAVHHPLREVELTGSSATCGRT